MNKTKKMMNVTMLIALAILFHLIESMIPLPIPVPGFKLGLANIIGLIALYRYGFKEMLEVNIMRVLLASLLRGIIFGTPFYLSLGGVLLSSLAAYIAYKKTSMSIYGVSVACSTFHCVGQVIVVTMIYNQFLMAALLPVLLVLSIPTGLVTGYLGNQVLIRIKEK
ncbi:MAG: Gx transporter family protein [Erysipelotrichaceae bacterium]